MRVSLCVRINRGRRYCCVCKWHLTFSLRVEEAQGRDLHVGHPADEVNEHHLKQDQKTNKREVHQTDRRSKNGRHAMITMTITTAATTLTACAPPSRGQVWSDTTRVDNRLGFRTAGRNENACWHGRQHPRTTTKQKRKGSQCIPPTPGL